MLEAGFEKTKARICLFIRQQKYTRVFFYFRAPVKTNKAQLCELPFHIYLVMYVGLLISLCINFV